MFLCVKRFTWIWSQFLNWQVIISWGTVWRSQVISQSNDYPVQSRLSLQWRHNGRDSVSNHQPHDWLLNSLFKRRLQKTSKLRVTGLCARNSPGTGEFPTQMASNEENVSIWWLHHVCPDCGRVTLAMHSVGCWKTATLTRKQPNIQRGVGFSVKIHWNGNVVFLITFHHWLHWKLFKWQLPVQPVIKISSKPFHNSILTQFRGRLLLKEIIYTSIGHIIWMNYYIHIKLWEGVGHSCSV